MSSTLTSFPWTSSRASSNRKRQLSVRLRFRPRHLILDHEFAFLFIRVLPQAYGQKQSPGFEDKQAAAAYCKLTRSAASLKSVLKIITRSSRNDDC